MTTPPRAPHPRNPLAVVAAPVQTMLSSLWHQPESRRGRAIRFSVIWIACLGLTVGLLFVIVGKANASCAASGSDPTCPVPAQFAGKFRAGYFTKAKGIPTGKVFNTPVKVHDLFINKYKNLYKNASDDGRRTSTSTASTSTTTPGCGWWPLTGQRVRTSR